MCRSLFTRIVLSTCKSVTKIRNSHEPSMTTWMLLWCECPLFILESSFSLFYFHNFLRTVTFYLQLRSCHARIFVVRTGKNLDLQNKSWYFFQLLAALWRADETSLCCYFLCCHSLTTRNSNAPSSNSADPQWRHRNNRHDYFASIGKPQLERTYHRNISKWPTISSSKETSM